MKSTGKGVKMLITIVALLGGSAVLFAACSQRMGAVQGSGLQRAQQSEHFRDGRFTNTVRTEMGLSSDDTAGTIWDFLRGDPARVPAGRVPTVAVDPGALTGENGPAVTWLGHSTCLIEIDGRPVLTDPMFSDRASPLPSRGERDDH